jgi:hypothetical protein
MYAYPVGLELIFSYIIRIGSITGSGYPRRGGNRLQIVCAMNPPVSWIVRFSQVYKTYDG